MLPRSSLLLLPFLFTAAAQPNAEILWDRYGVPHVYAKDNTSLMRGFGYAQMHSHANVILKLYGEARGRSAEYWGDSNNNLRRDTWLRRNDVPGIAKQWYAQQKPEYKAMLDAFAEGMNWYARKHPETIEETRRVVLPISGEDVLAHGLRVIQFEFMAPQDIMRGLPPGASRPGSNAWAIGPKRSASGKAILVANPHLLWGEFFLFYEAHIVGPGIDIYGTTLVGHPSISIGFNKRLGWTHTVNTHDGVDFFELLRVPGGYEWDGGVKPFEEHREVLKVKEKDGRITERPMTFLRSIHGPVVAEREKEGKALAMRVAGLDGAFLFEQYWRMAQARSFKEFEAAQRMLQMPMFTTMYADADGHIYHLFGGKTPVRAEGDWSYWRGIAPGNASKYLWTKTHPYEDLPKWLDPPSGYLQNANDPPWTTTFPKTIKREEFPPYMAPNTMALRPQRSARMLEEDKSLTFEEVVKNKLSTRMEAADRMLDELIAAARASTSDQAKQAAEVLAKWDRCADVDSRGGVLFAEFFRQWQTRDKKPWTVAWSEGDPLRTPRGIRDPELAVQALIAASGEIEKRYKTLDVAWGDVYRLRSDDVDLPSNGAAGELGVFRVTYSQADKDGKLRTTGGDSFYAIVEFGSSRRARVLLGYGNSTQPGSKHRTDQLPLYSRKEMRTPWLTRGEIEKHLEKRELIQ